MPLSGLTSLTPQGLTALSNACVAACPVIISPGPQGRPTAVFESAALPGRTSPIMPRQTFPHPYASWRRALRDSDPTPVFRPAEDIEPAPGIPPKASALRPPNACPGSLCQSKTRAPALDRTAGSTAGTQGEKLRWMHE